MKHPSEEQLVLLYYGELENRAAAEEHLAACAPCRQAYESLADTLAGIQPAPVPERGEDYGARVWQRLRPRLAESAARPSGSGFWQWIFPPRRWALAASMAVLVLAAFLAGRFWPAHRTEIEAARPPAPQVRERILLVAVGDHLERSQMVLLELVNSKPERQMDISEEQQRAQDLIASNRLYRQAAARTGDARVADVLDELERVLMEIAHSPSRLSSREFEELRQRVEAQGILFKVRIIDSQVREKTASPTPKPAPRTAPGGSNRSGLWGRNPEKNHA